jgi:hypothetical protein
MFEGDNRFYYQRRAEQAIELGYRATEPKIAALHFELALRYEILAVQGSQARPQVVTLSRDDRSLSNDSLGVIGVIVPNQS